MSQRRRSQTAAVVIIRASVEPGPIIHIVCVRDVLRDERTRRTTTSPDEAAAIVREWLRAFIERAP